MYAVRAKHHQSGFTLTELLVAMAIFMILMSALLTLFSSAIAAVRQGYASIDTYETGRMAQSILGRDLNGAFTAREHGDTYNFYGRPDGFMFVGALANGQVGRVTYVVHSNLGNPTVRMQVSEKWKIVKDNLRRQAERNAREMGYTGDQVLQMVGGHDSIPAYQNGLIDEVRRAYPGNGGLNPNEEWIEYEVEVEIGRLIRFEETGYSDLDTFDMRAEGAFTIGNGDDVVLDWPYVDPINPLNDATPAPDDGDLMQDFLLGAVDPTPLDNALDLRLMFSTINETGGRTHPETLDTLYLRALGRDTFDQLLKARKREFWLRMLGDNFFLDMPMPSVLTPFAPDGSVGYWYDEALSPNSDNPRKKRVINEYVIADGIVLRTRVIHPATDQLITIPLVNSGGTTVGNLFPDVLDADTKFSYGDGANQPLHYFNDIQNLRDPDNPDGVILSEPPGSYEYIASMPILLGKGNKFFDVGFFTEFDLVEADKALADTLLGNRSNRKNLGSPLAPRIPSVVTTDFWVTRTRTRPGAPDILKRFSQTVQIPTAQGRSVSTTIAQGPGASL